MENKKTSISNGGGHHHHHKSRDIDVLAKDVKSWWQRTFLFVKKNEVKSLYSYILIAFVIGTFITILLLVNFNLQTKSKAYDTGIATLTWNANNESDLAGYKIYYGTTARTSSCPPGGYSSNVDVGNVTTYTFNNLTTGQTYYFSITAYDNSNPRNESCFSAQVSKLIPQVTCTSFLYSNWGACQSNGTQTRTVLASSPAGCIGGNPVLSQACTYSNTCTSFTYSAWGACQSNNTQTRTVTSSSPTGCTGGNPVLSQACTYSNTCTSFTYSAWGACQPDNTQTRTVLTSSPAGCTGGNPILSQSCSNSGTTCTSFKYSRWSACQPDGTRTRSVISSSPTGCTQGNPVITQSCRYK